MLKKAGIVVAAAAAGLLAVSPLAFADDEQKGLVNVNDVSAQVPVQACGNDVASGVVGILAKDLKNNSSDEVDCEQSAEVDD